VDAFRQGSTLLAERLAAITAVVVGGAFIRVGKNWI
jgi:hypothetical protein